MTTTESVEEIGFVTEQIEAEARTRPDAAERRQRRADTLRPIMWRLHFVGGFLAAPIIVSLALTGILFAWNPQIDDVRFGSILHQTAGGTDVALAEQVKTAAASHPDWKVFSVTPGRGDNTTAVTMDPPGGQVLFGSPTDGVNVYVNRTTGKITGDVPMTDTTAAVVRTWHSSWSLGANFEPLTELGGSLFLVTLLTGLYLWWPGLRKRGTIAFAARRGLRGRRRSKEFHNFIGVTLFVPMIFLAATGLAWTQFASGRMSMVDKRLSPTSGSLTSALPTPAPGHQDPANIDKVWDQAQKAGLSDPVQIVAPANDKKAWTATSQDGSFPIERDAIAVNGTTGEVVNRFDYSSEAWFNKLQTAGQLFHEGSLFGVFSQVLMSLLAAAIAVMIWYGYKMWWQRRPAGGMGAPPSIRNWLRNAPVAVIAATVFFAWLLPVLAVAFAVWLVVEAGWRWLSIARGRQSLTTAEVA
jgi:uncharacterized iron-regulated membrane protein